MEVIQYSMVSIITMSGFLAGKIISALTKEEHKHFKQFLEKIVFNVSQYKIYSLLALFFAIASFTKYFFLTTSIIFIYSIIVAYLLATEKKDKELLKAGVMFIIVSVIVRTLTNL